MAPLGPRGAALVLLPLLQRRRFHNPVDHSGVRADEICTYLTSAGLDPATAVWVAIDDADLESGYVSLLDDADDEPEHCEEQPGRSGALPMRRHLVMTEMESGLTEERAAEVGRSPPATRCIAGCIPMYAGCNYVYMQVGLRVDALRLALSEGLDETGDKAKGAGAGAGAGTGADAHGAPRRTVHYCSHQNSSLTEEFEALQA